MQTYKDKLPEWARFDSESENFIMFQSKKPLWLCDMEELRSLNLRPISAQNTNGLITFVCEKML